MTKSFSSADKQCMKRLLDEAAAMKGFTSPNPMTAAMVVQGKQVISIGVHQGPGQAHAEEVAIKKAADKAKNATLYVNLEPCTHWGENPPCVDVIIKAGIKKVVYAILDPNPKVRENPAADMLRQAGIEVVSGLLKEEALLLNASFFKRFVRREPFVTLKAGMSLDGKIALSNGESKYITSEKSRKVVHQMRWQSDAILIGIKTVIIDNPSLDIRYNLNAKYPRYPKLMILDPHAKCPPNSALFNKNPHAEIILLCDKTVSVPSKLAEKVTVWGFTLTNGKINWSDILKKSFENDVVDILIEGGVGVFSSAIEDGAVDKVDFFMAPKLFAGKDDPSVFATQGANHLADVMNIQNMTVKSLGPDIHVSGYLKNPKDWFV